MAMIIYLLLAVGCSVKNPINNEYKLDAHSTKRLYTRAPSYSILISQPEAATGYQTEQMLYSRKPYEILPFAHNAWIGPPASMLFPLIMQTLQQSGYFYAVATTPYADKADFRLDTQLIELQQNFICIPSQIEMVVKVVLTKIDTNTILGSRILRQRINCPEDTPYGGVIAANQAAAQFTALLSTFVIDTIKRKTHHHVVLSKRIAKNSKQLYNVPPSRLAIETTEK